MPLYSGSSNPALPYTSPTTHNPYPHIAFFSLPLAADLDKVAAAQEVLRLVAAHSPASAAIVRQMGELIDGYIELAATDAPRKDAEEMAFPAALRRSRQ